MVNTKNKKYAQRKHALNRANNRCDLVFSKAVRTEFLSLIQTSKSICMYKQSLRASCHKVNYQDIDYYVIYDKIRKEIVTFLTEQMVNDTINDMEKYYE